MKATDRKFDPNRKFDPRPMPRIGDLKVLEAQCVEVSWAEGPRAGQREIVDLSPMINRYKAYASIRNDDAFASVSLADDGEMLEWLDGAVDMPATNVEYLAEQQMTGRQFNAFLREYKLTRAAAAAEFGKSLRSIQNYLALEGPLPRSMALACKGFAATRAQLAARTGGKWAHGGSTGIVVVYREDASTA